ncbi:membrane protein [Streptomyces sp. NRRL F-6491]|nr:membrane protein [Streptomyces sp. NRRL F-6491]KOX48329.1 membrane protein [Streptomyces sp. NRRL F-6492]
MGLRRWRRNPLRRTTDLVEAWAALVSVVLLCVAVPLVGWSAGASAHDSLRLAVRAQEERRTPVTARVVRLAETSAHGPRTAESGGEERLRRSVVARWTAPDGSPRTGTVTTSRRHSAPGAAFSLWTDRDGRPVPPPMRADTARAHAITAGLMAALLSGLLVETVRRLVVRRLVLTRYARLDRAWAATGPDWGRAGAGS